MARNVIPIETGTWKTGGTVPKSGIYAVRHAEHRLPDEVTLIQGQQFPRCEACESMVFFRMRRRLSDGGARQFHISLYQLPVIGESKRAS